MFERLIRLSVRNSVFVNLVFIVIVLAGIVSAFRLPREQFPEISLDKVAITTVYPGATAEDVEELLTKPIEDTLDDVSDIDRIQSTSQEGTSSIVITFLDGTNIRDARSEVEKAVSSVEDLPDDAEVPLVQEAKLELPVVSVALLGDRGATQLVDRLADELRDLDGVATINISGLGERRIFVDLDERELRAVGLEPSTVVAAIQRSNANVPAGTVELRGQDIFVKTEHRIRGAADVAKIPVAPGSPRRISDVAQVKEIVELPDTRFWVDGEPAVKLTVGREETADPLRIREAVLEELERLRTELPPGTRIKLADDFTHAIRDRLDTVVVNALGGGVLVMLVLFVMSGTRQALLALWGMPVSYLAATFLMGQTGMSINVVSTFALLIATGIIVDDAIVVIENVQRHLEMGKNRIQATLAGAKEVALPVTVAVLTTCLAFIPLTMVGGTMGRIMRILPLVVIFCLLGSLIEAVLILPGHLAHFASTDAHSSRTARLSERMKAVYAPPLRWCIRHHWLAFFLVTVGMVGVGGIASKMDFLFGAPAKPYDLRVHYEIMPGLDRATTQAQGEAIDAVVRKHFSEEIRSTTLRVGSILDQENGFTSTGANLGYLRWEFDFDEEDLERYPDMVRDLRMVLATNPDLARAEVREAQAGPPSGAAITARLRGRDKDELNRSMAAVKTALYGMEGVADIRDNYGSGKETFRVVVDQDTAARLGLTELDIGRAVRTALDGTVAAEVSIEEEPVDIVVRYANARGRSRSELGDLVITSPRGDSIRLDQVAELRRTREVGFVRREDGQRTVSVLADVDSDVVTSFEATQRLQRFWDRELSSRFPGVSLSFGGEADELRSSLDDLPLAFLFALLCIYVVLALQFGSYLQPLIIMAAIPFGLAGAVLGLFLMGFDLSLMAMFGMVALMGIVVNDSLVMVDFINGRMKEGASAAEACEEGALARLRPILSTTLTTCLGLLPLGVGLGGRDLVLAPMAIAIAAGLGFATLLVLLVVPSIFMIVEDVRASFRRTPVPPPDASARTHPSDAGSSLVDGEHE